MAKRYLERLGVIDVERALRDGSDKPKRLADGGGLYLNIRSHSASWVYVYTDGGKQREETIGAAHRLADASGFTDSRKRAAASLKAAREKAAELRQIRAQGHVIRAVQAANRPVRWSEIYSYYAKVKKVEDSRLSKYVKPWQTILDKHGTETSFTRDMAVEYRDSLLEKMKPYTVKGYVKMLGAMFNLYIIDKQSNIKNPFSRLSVEDHESDIERRNPMDMETILIVREKLEGDYQIIWDLVALTGARVGEIAGLKSSDITEKFINIERNDKRTLKNKVSKRIIPGPPPLKWSAVMFRKRRIENGKQTTEAGRDCLEVAAG